MQPVANRLADLLGIGLTIWIGSQIYRVRLTDIFRFSIRMKHDVFGGVLLAALSLGAFALNKAIYSAVFSGDNLQYYVRGIEAVRGSAGPTDFGQLLLTTCFLSPIIEELLFSGFLFSMAKVHYRGGMAMLAVGIMFAAVHFNLPYLPAIFLTRILYLLLFYRTGSLTGPVIAHCLHNLAVVLGVFRGIA